MKTLNRRTLSVLLLSFLFLLLLALFLAGPALEGAATRTDFSQKDLSPSLRFPFGTDWMGRDMLARTICGLSISLRFGLLTAAFSALLALLLGAVAGMLGGAADSLVTWLIDLLMGVPHLLLLLLISFACGRGQRGVVMGIILTHWMSLARLLRAETRQLRGSGYVLVAAKLGISRGRILARHLLPHLWPQFLTGLLLLFPHAILHEASITFLGFGLPPEQPAIGIILSESMRYLALGEWWLAVFPGLSLVALVLLFSLAGNLLRSLLNPATTHL